MEPPYPTPARRVQTVLDGLLILLLGVATFVLGCQVLYDSDIWWHVRAGQWIWSRAEIPATDPFTYGSLGRPWIDLHWIFQLLIASAHALDGVRGMIVFAAILGAAVVLTAFSARDRRAPAWLMVLCWIPAIWVMSARLVPRPEVLSLLAMSIYLVVLRHAAQRPALLWALVPVQILWVNAHALFVLGPIILTLYLLDRLMISITGQGPVPLLDSTNDRRWPHQGGAFAAILLACLINPYGPQGAFFPFQLLPKITAWGAIYKSSIIEFMDLQEYIRRQTVPLAAANLYNRAQCLLLWMLPLVLIVPALWRTNASSSRPTGRPWVWLMGFSLATCSIVITAIGLPGEGTRGGMIRLGRVAPLVPVALGFFMAMSVPRSSTFTRRLSALAGLSLSAWIVWSKFYLFGIEPWPSGWPGTRPLGVMTALLGLATTILLTLSGARTFRLMLAVAFGYLDLQAIRNVNLFGLAAGYVLATEIGEWVAAILHASPPQQTRERRYRDLNLNLAATISVMGLTILMIIATMNDSLFRATRERRGFGLSAAPLAYAHAAAKYAAQPGLPDRALVYDLRQAAVYEFHNGPERKPFLDGRLEVADIASFKTFTQLGLMLNGGIAGWADLLHVIGDPLILLDHEKNAGAEATLLANADWRCIFYDSVAAVFIPSSHSDPEHHFPTLDFAARHFSDPPWPSTPFDPLGAGQAKALLELYDSLKQRPGSSADLRLSLLLRAADHLHQAIERDPSAAEDWALLGNALWSMTTELALSTVPSGSDQPWNPISGITSAQSSYCYRRALALDPGQITALFALHDTFRLRRMEDAQRSISVMMRRAYAAARDPDYSPTAEDHPDASSGIELSLHASSDPDAASLAISALLGQSRPEAAVRMFEAVASHGVSLPWTTTDRVATALLYLGRPLEARRLWEQSETAPTPALRAARLAAASLAAFDWTPAQQAYTTAATLNPQLAEAWVGLVLLETQRGHRAQTLATIRKALTSNVTPAQKSLLERLDRLATQK